MKTHNNKSSLLNAATGLALMLITCLLLTNCGSSKKVTETSTESTSGITEVQTPEYELRDDCALLHIYRKGSMAGAAISYDLYLDNDMIFRVKNKSKTTIVITKEGLSTLSAKTETKTELPIDIQLGKEYYVCCGIKMGALVGRPKIELVDNSQGKSEYNKIVLKKK